MEGLARSNDGRDDEADADYASYYFRDVQERTEEQYESQYKYGIVGTVL